MQIRKLLKLIKNSNLLNIYTQKDSLICTFKVFNDEKSLEYEIQDSYSKLTCVFSNAKIIENTLPKEIENLFLIHAEINDEILFLYLQDDDKTFDENSVHHLKLKFDDVVYNYID